MKFFKRYKMRIIFTAIGLAVAISYLTAGFLRTTLVLVCCGIGFFIGFLIDNHGNIPKRYQFWRKKW